MNVKTMKPKLIPVVKKGRKTPKIPFLQSPQVLEAARREEEMLAQLGEGTTPQGCELLCKVRYFMEKAFWNKRPLAEILARVEQEIVIFSVLRGEWLLLLSREWGISHLVELEHSTPRAIASIMVGCERLRWGLKIERRRRGEPFPDEYEERTYQRWLELVNAEQC